MAAPVIAQYDPRWPALFDRLKALLRSAIGDEVISIDHIGPTSVPGLAAKDVIDVQVTAASLDRSDAWPNQIGPFHRRHGIVQDHVPLGEAAGWGWEALLVCTSHNVSACAATNRSITLSPRQNSHMQEHSDGHTGQNRPATRRDQARSSL